MAKVLAVSVFALILATGCTTVTNTKAPSSKTQDVVANEQTQTKTAVAKIIRKKEEEHSIPKGLLMSISKIESKTTPYAVNARKKSYTFSNKADAIKFIDQQIKNGVKNISIGCMQIHVIHKGNFSSIADMLEPEKNVAYSAKLFKTLYKKYGTWERAVIAYHTGSTNNKYGRAYLSKVMRELGRTT